MGEKPTEGYIAHPADAARLEEAEELHFNDYAKITTGQEHYVIPQTVSQSAAANVIADFTSPPMLRAVLVALAVQGLLGKLVPEAAELEGLACSVLGDYFESAKAFEVTRAVPRSQAKATSQEPEFVWEAELPLSEGKEIENVPAHTITTTELSMEVDCPRCHANAGDSETPSRDQNGNVIRWRNHRRTPAAVKADQGKIPRGLSGRSHPCWKG